MKIKQLLILTIAHLMGVYIFLINPTQSFAQVIFTDDFSNGYEQWQDVRNTFDLWSIVEEKANVFIDKRSTLAELIPKDEYWNSEWKNYIYTLDYTYLQGADKALSFWYQDTLNWYQFHFVGNNYILSHIENGREVWKKTGGLVLRAGSTYNMEVHLEDGNIKFYVDGVEFFDVDDPTFNNDHGTIGIKSGAGNIFPTHVQFDNIEISLISDIVDFILPINTLKQIDPIWKDVEYDSATNWAKSTFGIGDWGCLVTSINMILNYHEIYNFPDGTKITPQTLNKWLKEQEDGFIGPGLVNWAAISRLVKEIHDLNGTVNLEYSRVATNPNDLNNPVDIINLAIAEIQDNKPVILEIPGHFLVGNGINQLQDDLFITDPAYSYNLLSQHQKPLKSTRLLTPSYTDLSFIHLGHSNSINVVLKDSDNNNPSNYQTFTQSISSFSSSEVSPEYILHELSKPESGLYLLKIFSNSDLPVEYTVTIFAYNIDANLSNLTYSGVAGTSDNSTTLIIDFNKDGLSSISTNSSFEQILKDIQDFKNKNEITKNYVSYELNQLVNAAISATSENKPRYINAILVTIDWYSNYISEPAQQLLKQKLIEIENNL